MRITQWLFSLGVVVILFASQEAQAISCLACGYAYNTCLYYAETTYQDWRAGCDRSYTPGSNLHTQCVVQGDQIYSAKLVQCEEDADDCAQRCEFREDPEEGCPVIIDLGGHGLRLSSVDGGVAFDINADGQPDRIAWTDAAEGDGFLVWDRNHNGRIDSGRELFGNYTPQELSDTPNGFLALALLDRPQDGGNGDGVISESDRAWASLRVWIDANQNGVSEAGELTSLGAHGIQAVEFEYRQSRRKDRHGNELRYRARVVLEDGFADAVDVFFRKF